MSRPTGQRESAAIGGSHRHDAGPVTELTRSRHGVSHITPELARTQNFRFWSAVATDPHTADSVHIGGSARGYLAVGGASQQSGMAYWMVACSVYLYIAILGTNVRICRESVGVSGR